MKELKTSVEINASPEQIWNELTNFSSYPNWNPFIKKIEGRMETGSNIKVEMTLDGNKGFVFEPKLLRFEKNREFRWKGKMWFDGIFDGEHYFILERMGNGTLLTQGERFTGILTPILVAMIGKKTRKQFQAMNDSLKMLLETPVPVDPA